MSNPPQSTVMSKLLEMKAQSALAHQSKDNNIEDQMLNYQLVETSIPPELTAVLISKKARVSMSELQLALEEMSILLVLTVVLISPKARFSMFTLL